MIVFQYLAALIVFLGLISDKGDSFLLNHVHTSRLPTSIKSFDFSSAMEWDEFYKNSKKCDSIAPEGGSLSTEGTAKEWHSSISLDEIASVVPPNGRCLVIGCGNSFLPDRILVRQDTSPSSLVLLDTSQTCLDQLQERHQILECFTKSPDRSASQIEIEYVCGDATQLSNCLGVDDGDESKLFDLIIDKGLTDAILCGEGWDAPLEKLFYESAKILSMDTGQYLLISYQLPSSTKNFLMDVGDKVGLKWDFDFNLAASNQEHQSVSVAMATKIKR